MPAKTDTLRSFLDELKLEHGFLAIDELFVLWFMRAYLTSDAQMALQALTGGPGDGGSDAVLLDDDAEAVFVVQGKYRTAEGAREGRKDVIAFANLANYLLGDTAKYNSYASSLDHRVTEHLKRARGRLIQRQYRLELYYATTGTVSSPLKAEAETVARTSNARLIIKDKPDIAQLVNAYLLGESPPIPSAEIQVDGGSSSSQIHRFDPSQDLESWVFTAKGSALIDLYRRAGIRLFAKNIRGFLGHTTNPVNRAMMETLRTDPARFWYYNNGVTIVCTDAEQSSKAGRTYFHMANPQIINGQQTTRSLFESDNGGKASVIVRLIRLPRTKEPDVVTKITSATNSQSQIAVADLKSNDRHQIQLERRLRAHGYYYVRKRMTKGEARGQAGRGVFILKKEDLAQVVAACVMDPAIARSNKAGLWEDQFYHAIFIEDRSEDDYLFMYWLGEAVRRAARGNRDRGGARWFVVHVLTKHLQPILRSAARRKLFIASCEGATQNPNVTSALEQVVEQGFRWADRFYRLNRGTGRSALTSDAFFKRLEQPKQFDLWYKQQPQVGRLQLDKAVRELQSALQ